jgi:DNA (cytosine-5)-methyltransferase 1
MKTLKVASFFAGVGGIDLGFAQTGKCKTVYANEFDPYSVKTFEKNFKVKVDCRDIREVEPTDVPDVDGYCFGFPCQPFSTAGYKQGFNDTKGRGSLFFEVMRIVHEKHPRFLFAENVKNLVSHDNGKTFKIILEALQAEVYKYKYQVLNAMGYGNVPQNRERIYIVGFRNVEDFERFTFPNPVPLKKKLSDIIDFDNPVDDKYYYTEGKYKGNIYEKLVDAMNDSNTVYHWRRKYVRKNMSGVVPTLTANQGEGGHNVCLIKTKYGIRKMTPRECFNAQGFPKNFKLPKNLADSRLYKQAGNSVCVPLIKRIAENMIDAMYH